MCQCVYICVYSLIPCSLHIIHFVVLLPRLKQKPTKQQQKNWMLSFGNKLCHAQPSPLQYLSYKAPSPTNPRGTNHEHEWPGSISHSDAFVWVSLTFLWHLMFTSVTLWGLEPPFLQMLFSQKVDCLLPEYCWNSFKHFLLSWTALAVSQSWSNSKTEGLELGPGVFLMSYLDVTKWSLCTTTQ